MRPSRRELRVGPDETSGRFSLVMSTPSVSIILPTYNRARFLPAAFEAIRGQTFTDWELIVVDDGSTDDTSDVVASLTRGWVQPVRYIHQENQGAYSARNAGVDLARGRYVAFYDSDDLWLTHYLLESIQILDAHEDIDWVYTATKVVDLESGSVLMENCFYESGSPRPFLSLKTAPRGGAKLLVDRRTIAVAIRHALYSGLQASILRSHVVRNIRLPPFRVGEDQVFSILALSKGIRIAYFDRPNVVYLAHPGGVSAACHKGLDLRITAAEELIRAFESISESIELDGAATSALRSRLATEYFWILGYSLLWEHGHRFRALKMFEKGLRHTPWDLKLWKTYIVSRLKSLVVRDRFLAATTHIDNGVLRDA